VTRHLLLLLPLVLGCASLRISTPALHGTATAAIAADCGTTLAMPWSAGYVETNPLLGATPTNAEIAGWCLVGLGVTHGGAVLLPERWRRGWLTWITVMELTFVLHNLSLMSR